jgi:hypothetical protein
MLNCASALQNDFKVGRGNMLAPGIKRMLSLRRLSFPIVGMAITLFLLCQITSVLADDARKPLEDLPMDFVLVYNGNCQKSCVQWISAEGEFTAATPVQLRNFLKELKGQKNLPVVFQSHGGEVDAALMVGRMIRAAGLETAVGRTQLTDCPMLEPRCPQKIVTNGWSEGEVRAGSAFCFSACPFALAGGHIRAAAINARIGLHQLTNGSKSASYGRQGRRNLNAISTKSDPKLKRILKRYFAEMAVSSAHVFAMMGLATPDGLYNVQNAEALKSGLITKAFLVSEEPGYVVNTSK